MRSRSRLSGYASALSALVMLTGCGERQDPELTDDPTSARATATSDDSPEPEEPTDAGTGKANESNESNGSGGPELTEQPTSETTRPTRPTGPRAALLNAATLPAPGDVVWKPGTTQHGTGPDNVSVCQVVELDSIGATNGAISRFKSGSVRATHVVARFADELSSTQAYEVLQAWVSGCARQARTRGFEHIETPRGLTPLTAGDAAGWALVSYGPVPADPYSSYIETQSLVRVADTLSWVVWRQIGQDYNYAKGQTPPELAIPLLAERLS